MAERTAKQNTAAVVVTYNRRELLMQCLSRLLSQQGAVCDILVVDNASTDNTRDAVAELKNERVYYQNTGANLGGAGGFSWGMRWAAEAGYPHVWLMDDDTLPEPTALQELLSADARLNGEYGFLSSTVLWLDGHECRMNRQKISKQFYEHIELLQDGMIQIEQATFVSLFLPIGSIERFGLPLREYFIWGDDIEYTRRLAVRGKMPCYAAGKSVVVHAMQSNSGSSLAADDIKRLPRYRLAYRNETCTYRREGVRGCLYYAARCCRDFALVWKNAKNHRLRRSMAILAGCGSGIFFFPKTEYIKRGNSI